jgi:Holliday junction resolvase RusA-like endonuclease
MNQANNSVLVIIEGEPVGKGRPKASSRGGFVRMYTPEKTRSYEQLVGDEARKAMAGQEPTSKPVDLELTMVFGVPASWSKTKKALALSGELFPTKKPDIDNVIKAICDSFNGIVWVDDVQVVDLVARKRYGEHPHIEARIIPIKHPADRLRGFSE